MQEGMPKIAISTNISHYLGNSTR